MFGVWMLYESQGGVSDVKVSVGEVVSKVKIAITTFLLPQELDAYERILFSFLNASQYVDGNNYELLTVVNLSDYFIDWENSPVTKEYFVQRFEFLRQLTDWTPNVKFEIHDDICGATDLKRKSLEMCPDATHFLWLDSDIAFDNMSLHILENSIKTLQTKNITNYVLTPEIVKMWDSSWDCIVNEGYMNDPFHYIGIYNAFKECGIKGEISLEIIDTFKFAAGWFTCISRPLLELIPLPKSLGPYYMDDTYIMEAAKIYNSAYPNTLCQIKIKNFVVCPDHRYYRRPYYELLAHKKDRRDSSKEIAERNFFTELNRFYERIYKIKHSEIPSNTSTHGDI